MTADQKIISNNIDDAGYGVGIHRDFGVSCPSLCSIDHHGYNIKDHPTHNNLKINHRSVMGIRCGSTLFHQPSCQTHTGNRDDRAEENRKKDCLCQRFICSSFVFFSCSSGQRSRQSPRSSQKIKTVRGILAVSSVPPKPLLPNRVH